MAGYRVRREPALFRVAPGFVVVASVAGGSVEMAGSAAAIWAALPTPDQEPIEIATLVQQLVVAYGIDPEHAERDARTVIESLEAISCAVRFT